MWHPVPSSVPWCSLGQCHHQGLSFISYHRVIQVERRSSHSTSSSNLQAAQIWEREGRREGMGSSSGLVDWRGRPVNPKKHGGVRASIFIHGMELELERNTCILLLHSSLLWFARSSSRSWRPSHLSTIITFFSLVEYRIGVYMIWKQLIHLDFSCTLFSRANAS